VSAPCLLGNACADGVQMCTWRLHSRSARPRDRPIAVLLRVLDHWPAVAILMAVRLMCILCDSCAACPDRACEKSAGDETRGMISARWAYSFC
jgi:hypothetical protein